MLRRAALRRTCAPWLRAQRVAGIGSYTLIYIYMWLRRRRVLQLEDEARRAPALALNLPALLAARVAAAAALRAALGLPSAGTTVYRLINRRGPPRPGPTRLAAPQQGLHPAGSALACRQVSECGAALSVMLCCCAPLARRQRGRRRGALTGPAPRAARATA